MVNIVMALAAKQVSALLPGSLKGTSLTFALQPLSLALGRNPLMPTGLFPGQRRGLRPATGAGGRSSAGVGSLCGCGERPSAGPCGLPLPSVPGGSHQAESLGRRLSSVATAGGPVQVRPTPTAFHPTQPLTPSNYHPHLQPKSPRPLYV